ncbi:MAG: AraC family transcriptional regulator, partial [Sphingobacteriales bacterium]
KNVLSDEQILNYKATIKIYLETGKAYLDPDISLDKLSKDLSIPKYLLSYLFNEHIGQGFYALIGQYRIEYSIMQIDIEKDLYTVDALSTNCGFSSKTSFNRYFKKHTGMTPNEYLLKKRNHS